MARTLRGYGLSAVLAAVDRRPALRGSRLVASAVLALRALYGDRQVCALRGDDRCAAVVLSGIVFVLAIRLIWCANAHSITFIILSRLFGRALRHRGAHRCLRTSPTVTDRCCGPR